MTKFDTQISKLLTENSKEEPVMGVDRYGNKRWRLKNDDLHREDGPAVEWVNGDKEWYLNGKRHREDGPAVESPDGYKAWYINDDKWWYINGIKLTEDEWKVQMNIKKNVSPEYQQSVLDILDL